MTDTARKPDQKSALTKSMAAMKNSSVLPAKWPSTIRPMNDPKQQEAVLERFLAYHSIRQPHQWQKWDLPLIAELAKLDVMCGLELDAVMDEGSSLMGANGGSYPNPAMSAYSKFFQNRMTLMTKLGLIISESAAYSIGNARDESRKLAGAVDEGKGLLA